MGFYDYYPEIIQPSLKWPGGGIIYIYNRKPGTEYNKK